MSNQRLANCQQHKANNQLPTTNLQQS